MIHYPSTNTIRRVLKRVRRAYINQFNNTPHHLDNLVITNDPFASIGMRTSIIHHPCLCREACFTFPYKLMVNLGGEPRNRLDTTMVEMEGREEVLACDAHWLSKDVYFVRSTQNFREHALPDEMYFPADNNQGQNVVFCSCCVSNSNPHPKKLRAFPVISERVEEFAECDCPEFPESSLSSEGSVSLSSDPSMA